MDALFREIKIYAAAGPEVRARSTPTCSSPTPSPPTARSSRRASPRPAPCPASSPPRTSYATRGVPMVPFYIFYSMFGFQRVGDLIWQAADMPGPRLPARRHRRAHHAPRRGPAAPGRPQPGPGLDRAAVPGLRPGLRLRDGHDRPPRHPAHVRAQPGRRLLLPDALQRELPHAGHGRAAWSRASSTASTGGPRRRTGRRSTPPCCSPASAQGAARQGGRGAGRALRRRRRAVVGHQLQGAAGRGAGHRAHGTASTPGRSSGSRSCAGCSARRRARSSPSPTS